MLRQSATLAASLRYRRPYWMLFLKGVDNWKIYTVIQQADHQRTEMLYQAWLGGLDRPYVRPKCMAHQPLWLSKKRHMMQRARLEGAETSLESYVLEWHKKFHSFQGTERPTAEDLHTAFDLVERPLDLSYACQLLNQCRNHFNICLGEDSFTIFLEACLRVDRKDCVQYALQHAEELGFGVIDENCRRYAEGTQSWYKLSPLNNLYYPLEENAELNKTRSGTAAASPPSNSNEETSLSQDEDESTDSVGSTRSAAAASTMASRDGSTSKQDTATDAESMTASHASREVEKIDDEIERLQAELAALEAAAPGELDTRNTSSKTHP